MFVAEERALGRKVVVKVLPGAAAAQVSIERFKREILLAARLQHPHIVPLLSAGESDGLPYFTMPFVEGESLRARLARHGELPVSDAVRILREIATALAYAHERGIVHRDIKPDNVLLSGGSAMVTDFGVAKALSASSNAEHGATTSLGVALGTPAYMAPEQASADPATDHRADIYAFGVLAYEMLTGQPPFVGRTPQNLLAAHVTETPESITRRRANLPPALAMLVMRCLAKRAADRPQSAAEIVRALDDVTTPSGGMQPTSAIRATAAQGPPQPAHRMKLARIAGAVLLVIAAAVWLVRDGAFGLRGAAIQDAPGAGAMKSLAVLPFENAGDTANAYFADGMTEAINSALSRIPGERVIPHSSAVAFRGKTVAEAGQKLGVDAIVEGTIRREGNRIRVTAGLVSVRDGSQIWSSKYDADAKDAFAVQDSVSTAIVDALRIKLSSAEHANIAAHGTSNAQAHDLVLRGRYLNDQYTEASLRSAVTIFKQAIALDSSYADAWAGLADSYQRLTDDWDPPGKFRAERKAAALHAVTLDQNSAAAHGVLAGELTSYDRDYVEGEREYVRALTLDSADASSGNWYPNLLLAFRRPDSAAAVIARAVRLNPYAYSTLYIAAGIFAYLGQGDRALALCHRLPEVSGLGSVNCESNALASAGRYGEALAALRRAPPPVTGAEHAGMAQLLARTGDLAGARRELGIAEEYAQHHYVREELIAGAYVALGDKDKAIEWLNRLFASGGASAAFLNIDYTLYDLRSDPRFQALVRRAGLPQ